MRENYSKFILPEKYVRNYFIFIKDYIRLIDINMKYILRILSSTDDIFFRFQKKNLLQKRTKRTGLSRTPYENIRNSKKFSEENISSERRVKEHEPYFKSTALVHYLCLSFIQS